MKKNIPLTLDEILLLRVGLRQASGSKWESEEAAKRFKPISKPLDEKLRKAQNELMLIEWGSHDKNHDA